MRTTIRHEAVDDIPVIEDVVAAAFRDAAHSSHTEHLIVNALRDSDALALSLLAESQDAIVGHVAISPVSISGEHAGWYGLGPIAVLPEMQGMGIGSQLMQQVLSELRDSNAAGCVVLGEPAYYGRFGFRVEASLVFPGVPPEYFQAISFDTAIPAGAVAYHDAFSVQE